VPGVVGASETSSWKLACGHGIGAIGRPTVSDSRQPAVRGVCREGRNSQHGAAHAWHYLFLNEKADPAEWSATFCDRMIDELGRFEPVVV